MAISPKTWLVHNNQRTRLYDTVTSKVSISPLHKHDTRITIVADEHYVYADMDEQEITNLLKVVLEKSIPEKRKKIIAEYFSTLPENEALELLTQCFIHRTKVS